MVVIHVWRRIGRISHTDPGTCRVFINNVRSGLSDGDPEFILDTCRIATAIVPGNRRVGPAGYRPGRTTGTPVNLDVNRDLPAMATDDVLYGAFDVGSGEAPGSVGFGPVDWTATLPTATPVATCKPNCTATCSFAATIADRSPRSSI
ncbi:MAG TPA: hypothetical protein VFN13_06095 [Rudaea sp.]|nr:hypothetical protein [Rudaea sp.]